MASSPDVGVGSSLLVDLKIVTLEDLHAHDQTTFDLVAAANIQAQYHLKTESINALKACTAIAFNIPAERKQYWAWTQRPNGAIRPLRALTTPELANELGLMKLLQSHTSPFILLLLLDSDPDPDSDPATRIPPVIAESDKSGLALVFFKFYDQVASKVTYVGHALVPVSNNHCDLDLVEQRFRELAGHRPHPLVPVDAKLNAWKEVSPTDIRRVIPNNSNNVDDECALEAAVLQTGDIFVFVALQTPTTTETCPYPTPVEWYSHMASRLVVEFRSLREPDDELQRFSIECRKTDSYADVQQAVAQQLTGADPAKIQFTGMLILTMGPRHRPCEREPKPAGHDSVVLRLQTGAQCPLLRGAHRPSRRDRCDEEDQHRVPSGQRTVVEVHPLVRASHWWPRSRHLPLAVPGRRGQGRARLRSLRRPHHWDGTFRLMEVWNHKVGKVWDGTNSINRLDELTLFLVQETDPEEATFNPDTHIHIPVAHYVFSPYKAIVTHSVPFFMVIGKTELFSSVKARVQKKLQIPDEEFSKWKVTFCHYYRSSPLDDHLSFSSSGFRLDPYTSFLGLEHPDPTVRTTYACTTSDHTAYSYQAHQTRIIVKN